MSQPVPEGKEGFVTGQKRLTDKFGKFTRTIKEDEFKCPYAKHKDEWVNYVTTDYCESAGMGSGCKEKETCMAYKKAKFGTIEEQIGGE